MSTDKIAPITELFVSCQGEGKNIGQSAIFVRFKGCNLRCDFCDTHDEDLGLFGEFNIQDLSTLLLNKMVDNEINRLVITGGEPLMRGDYVFELIFLINSFVSGGSYPFNYVNIEIETNGTYLIPEDFFKVNFLNIRIQFNLSPKLENSGVRNYNKARLIKNVDSLNLHNKKANSNGFLKFDYTIKIPVMVDDLDKEIGIVTKFLDEIDISSEYGKNVYLMAIGIDRDKMIDDTRILYEARIAGKHLFNISSRLHILLWGHKRGV